MAIFDGQDVNALNSNAAWWDKSGPTTGTGTYAVISGNGNDGAGVMNIQREVNAINSFVGKASDGAYDQKPTWTNNDVGATTDDVKTRADGVTQKFNLTAGHRHTGVAGDAPLIDNRQPTFNGLQTPASFGLGYVGSTRTLTVTYAGTEVVWVNGVKFTKSGVQTLVHAATVGLWNYSYNTSGTLVVSQTPYDLLNCAPIAIVKYSDATHTILQDERHPAQTGFTDSEHRYLHLTRGTVLQSGCIASGYTVGVNTGNANFPYGISSGVIHDEDLITSVSALTKGGPYRICYRTGTDASLQWTWSDASTTGVISTSNDISYNQLTGGSWQLTGMSSNTTWTNYYVCATQWLNATQLYVIMGQSTYGSLALAQAEDPAVLSGVTALSPEIIFLYRVTYQRINNFNSSILASVQGIRSNNVTISGGNSPTDHNALTGRSTTDSHPASAISVTPSGNISSTDQASANVELQGDIDTLRTDVDAKVAKSSYTTKGDILVGTGTGTYQKLPVGGDDQVLSALNSETTGLKWVNVASGGGGGGASLMWIEGVQAPEGIIEFNQFCYLFGKSLTQNLYVSIHVPSTYNHTKIKLRMNYYSPDTSGTALFLTQSTYIPTKVEEGTDGYAISDTSLQRTSTNTAITLATTANMLRTVEFDITDIYGSIAFSDVRPNSVIKVRLYRDTNCTGTSDLRALPYTSEVAFS